MRFLLDTHVVLWALATPGRLSHDVAALLGDPDNVLAFSPVSLLEIAIKRTLNRPGFSVDARLIHRTLVDYGYEELPVRSEHAVAVGELPLIHKDPFDRILIAQAQVEGIVLLTSDATVARYPGPIRKI